MITHKIIDLINLPEKDSSQEDVIQIHFSIELPPSGGYENITAIDIFPRSVFICPVSSSTAVNSAKVVIHLMTRHSSQMWYTK